MKPTPWIFPGIAVLITGGWIFSQKRSAATLEREITVIRERIHRERSAGDAETRDRDAAGKEHGKKRIDWKDVAAKVSQMENGGVQDIRTMLKIQQMLMESSADELCAQLDEIAALGLDEMAKKQLHGLILGVLCEKDPKRALERFGHELGDEQSGMSWQLGNAMRQWADKEPAAAAAWMDAQIAAGKFESRSLDGRNQALTLFEGALVTGLMKTDPAAATARAAALTEQQREEFFQQGYHLQSGGKQDAAYAKLVRDTMPAEKVASILANAAGSMGDFVRVDKYIANAKATDNEKSAIVAQAMRNQMHRPGGSDVWVDKIEEARAWGATQSPSGANTATGEALGESLFRDVSLKQASELALKYHESTGTDEVLASFLKSEAVMNRAPDEAKALIDKIKDPALREEIRKLPHYQKPSP